MNELLLPETWAWDEYDMLTDGTNEAHKTTVAAKAKRKAELVAAATCDSVTLEDA